MSDSNAVTSSAVAAVVSSVLAKAFTERFTFKTALIGSPALDTIQKLMDASLLTEADVEAKKDEAGKVIGYARKNFDAVLQAPDVASLLGEHDLSERQVSTMQDLVQVHIAAYNKKHVVDEGKSEYVGWEKVLQEGLAIRKASSKVTTAMLIATTGAFTVFMADVLKAAPAGIELADKLASRKFSVAACNRVNEQILERFSEVIGLFSESLDAVQLETHLSVLELWASELEKTLNPQQEEMSIDLLGGL